MSPVNFLQRIIRGPAASPSHVAETSAAGAGGPASEDRFIPSSARPSASSASTSTPGERAGVDPSRLSMRRLRKLPEIQAWLASSPPSEHASRKTALQRILDCATNGGRLNLQGLGLTVLPECIGDIQGLKALYAGRNSLRSLPVSLERLQSLERLRIENNSFGELPESLGRLEQMKDLVVCFNVLVGLPESIGQLKCLERLFAGNNFLQSLPESIGDLQNLQELDVSENYLKDLPESIGRLQKLQNLFASDNSLNCLPESLGQLQNLETLNIVRNPLRSLPQGIERLRNLIVSEIAPPTMPESSMRRQPDRVVERPAIEPEDAWISEFISEHMPSPR